MEQKPVRQGVPVKEVKAKMVRSNRIGHLFPLISWPVYLLLLCTVSCIRGEVSNLYIYAYFLLPYLLYPAWFFAYKWWNYNFVAEDGFYIVRWGYAVHISWEMIVSVDEHARFLKVNFRSCLTDEATGTAFTVRRKGERRMWNERKTVDCFLRHVPIVDAV